MKNAYALWFMGVLLTGLSVTASAETDPRLRYANVLVKDIGSTWQIYAYDEFNTDKDKGHDLNSSSNEFGAVYSGSARWLDLGIAMGRWDGKNQGGWSGISYPYVFGTVKWTGLGMEISDRNRLEAMFREQGDDGMRYRNALTVGTAQKWTRLEIQPFICNEIFYDLDAKYATEDQVIAGINFRLTKSFSAALSYMKDLSNVHGTDSNQWKDQPMVVLATTLHF